MFSFLNNCIKYVINYITDDETSLIEIIVVLLCIFGFLNMFLVGIGVLEYQGPKLTEKDVLYIFGP